MTAVFLGMTLVLMLMVCILIGPPTFRDGPLHPGLLLCLLAVSVCLALLGLAARSAVG